MVLWSTPKSIEEGEASWLALLETILAVLAYWGVAWAFDTHAHLLVSVLFASLLWLRSPESTHMATENFIRYWNEKETYSARPLKKLPLLVAFTSFISAAIFFAIFNEDILSGDSTKNYIGIFLINFPIFLMCFFTMFMSFLISFKSKYIYYNKTKPIMMIIYICFALIVINIIILSFVSIYALNIYYNTYQEESYSVSFKELTKTTSMVALSIAFSLIASMTISFGPIALGIWIRSMAIRFTATLLNLPSGLRNISINLRHTLFIIDSHHQAELVPGLKDRNSDLTIAGMISSVGGNGWYVRLSRTYARVVWFLIALFYRWSLKSTCWFCLPLVYLTWPPEGSLENEKVWIREMYCGRMERLRQIIALLVVIGALCVTLSPGKAAQIRLLTEHAPIPTYLFAIDLQKIAEIPLWQWCGLLSAGATAVVWKVSERLQFHLTINGTLLARTSAHLRFLVRCRAVVSAVSMLLMLGFALLAFPRFYPESFPDGFAVDLAALPDWLGFIRWLYAPYLR